MRTATILFLGIVLLIPLGVAAQITETISYQGVLTDSRGNPIADGAYSIEFRLYDAPLAGHVLWSETKFVNVADGLFSTMLGDATPFSLAFDDTYWLELTRAGEAAMTPRIQLGVVPYALHALYAEQSGGGGSGSDNDWIIVGDNIYRETGQVAVGTVPTAKALMSSREGEDLKRAAPASKFVAKGGNAPLLGWLQEPDDAVDGRTGVYGYRDRDVANQGSGYGITESNSAVLGHNYRGDSYSFGVIGTTWWDNVRTGGVLGAQEQGDIWGSLAYRDENGDIWGIYTPDSAHVGQTLSTGSVVSDSVQTVTLITDDLQATTMQIGDLETTNLVSDDVQTTSLGSDSITATSLITGGLKLTTGAVDGYVLTSGSSGVGTWQPATGGFALPFSGSSGSADVALDVTNTSTGPLATAIRGHSNGIYGAHFTTDRFGSTSCAVRAEYEGSGPYDATAVYGKSTPMDSYGYGGHFEGGRRGVYGEVSTDVGDAADGYAGVEGVASASLDDGVLMGVYGHVDGGSQVSYGVAGMADGTGQVNVGVYGEAAGATVNVAALFSGDVQTNGDCLINGDLVLNGNFVQNKSATRIDHPLDPENRYLVHSTVASPDMMNVYNGNVVLADDGSAWVTMPDYFEALNRDFRYQLTPIGGAGPNLHVEREMEDGRFRIAGGAPGLKVSWQITGIRQDRFAEANPMQVEADKAAADRGRYLNPELYGRPSDEAIGKLDPGILNR